MIKYASVCSGVEAASLAWIPLGWKAAWFSEIEPFPCEVLKQRFPGVPNLGDMTKIKVENLENGDQKYTNGDGAVVIVPGGVDLLVGGTPCFPAGTMVLTPGGYKPIDTLKIGDEVVSHNGNVCKVSAVGSKTAHIGNLKIGGRPEIPCTDNHPFLTIDVKRDNRRKSPTYGKIIPCGDWDFTQAKDSAGKYAGRILSKPMSYSLPQTSLQRVDLLEFAGWYVGDGYIRRFEGKNKKAIILALVSPQKIETFKDHFEGKINFSIGADGKVTVYNTQIAEFLIENFGEKAQGKKVPYWLYSAEDLKTAFLLGVEYTDGCNKGCGCNITTISEALAYGIADLYGNASVRRQKVKPQKEIEGRLINQHDFYVVSSYTNRTPKTKFINGRYASRIKEFKDGNGAVGTVFNITVSGDHTYIVNGIAVHNCQSFSVAGKREGLDGASGLARTFVQLLESMQPRWFVWENVPGCLSSRNKQTGIYDFNFLLAAFAEVGYTCGWRILDAQYVRVDGYPRAIPQRRRRVFVVGHLGAEWQYPAEVLFEPHNLSWNTPPRRVKGQGTAADAQRCLGTASRPWDNSGVNPTLNQCNAGSGTIGASNQELFAQNFNGLVMSIGNGQLSEASIISEECCQTLNCMHDQQAVLCLNDQGGSVMNIEQDGNAGTLRANTHGNEQIVCQGDVCPAIDANYPQKLNNLDLGKLICVNGAEIPVTSTEHANPVTCNHNGLENVLCWAAGGFGQKVESDVSATISTDHDDRVTGNNAALIQERIGCYPSQHHAPKPCETPTLTTDNCAGIRGDSPLVQECYEWHSQDLRVKKIENDSCGTLSAGMGMGGTSMTSPVLVQEPTAVAIAENIIGRQVQNGGNGTGAQEELAYTQNTSGVMGVSSNATVRRLLPIECERLMGFPDNHTRISWKGKPAEECPDSPRYKACGNSMCVNVMRWIGMRIEILERRLGR